MSFVDIFKNSFLEGYMASNITVGDIVTCIIMTLLISGYVFILYRVLNRNSFYNKNFNLALPALAIITAAVILTIQSSIVISLGMVGALSIVRFRTAIKDPMDLVFLFWAISIGIMCGASLYVIAIVTSVILSIGLIIGNILPVAKTPMVLLVNSSSNKNEKEIMQVIKDNCAMYKVKARNFAQDHLDLAIEVKVKPENEMLQELMEIENILSVSLVSHDGEAVYS